MPESLGALFVPVVFRNEEKTEELIYTASTRLGLERTGGAKYYGREGLHANETEK